MPEKESIGTEDKSKEQKFDWREAVKGLVIFAAICIVAVVLVFVIPRNGSANVTSIDQDTTSTVAYIDFDSKFGSVEINPTDFSIMVNGVPKPGRYIEYNSKAYYQDLKINGKEKIIVVFDYGKYTVDNPITIKYKSKQIN